MKQLSLPLPSKNGMGADAPLYSVNFVDQRTHVGVKPQERFRKIKNNSYHMDESGLWIPSTNVGSQLQGNPAHWPMPWSPTRKYGGILETFVSSTPSDSPQGGGILSRLAHRPDLWASVAAANKVPGITAQFFEDNVLWEGLFPDNGDLEITFKTSKFKKVIKYPGMPTTFPILAIAVPDGCTILIENRQLKFLDENGDQYMNSKPAIGWWGANTLEEADGVENAGVGYIDLIDLGTTKSLGRTYRLVQLSPDPVTWSDSQGIVRFDPSVEISGDASIDGFYVKGNAGDWNYGGAVTYSTEQQSYTSGQLQSIIRTDASEYPAGDITSAVYSLYWISGGATEDDGTQSVHRMVDANAGYIQGSSTFPEDGAPCLNYKAYDDTTPTYWASGTIGLDSGTDYDATAGFTWERLLLTDIDQYNPYSLPPEWFEAWRNTPANNGGIYMKELVRYECSMVSTNGDPAKEPFLTLAYTTGGASIVRSLMHLSRRNRIR